MPLDEDVTRLAKGKNLATVVTLMPSGQPQALLTWVDADDEHVLVNTEPQRQRARNVARDPRITVLIHGETSPRRSARTARVILKVAPDKVNTPRLLGASGERRKPLSRCGTSRTGAILHGCLAHVAPAAWLGHPCRRSRRAADSEKVSTVTRAC